MDSSQSNRPEHSPALEVKRRCGGSGKPPTAAPRKRRDPLEVRGEHERHAVHEEKKQHVEHVQVLVRDGGGDCGGGWELGV